MPFSDLWPVRLRQCAAFCILLSIPAFFIFAKPAPENPDILSKVVTQLAAHYFRPLTPAELQAKSIVELFSSLDRGTHLESVQTPALDFVRGLSGENSITETKQIHKEAGYIRIAFLGRRTASDFRKALESLEREGVQNLILDLRGNPGGSVESGVEIIENFVPEGKLLFTLQGKTDREIKRYSQRKIPVPFPLTVLIDGRTASTAEIAAFALKRYAHAKLIGEPTYGKRSIQEVFPIDASHILFLTVAHFILPDDSGEKIKPDFLTSSEKALEETLSVILMKGDKTAAVPERLHKT